MPSDIEITMFKHTQTGMLMATSRDVAGFIVYAHSDGEMEKKLLPAYRAYMEAIGKPVGGRYEVVDRSTPGFWPPRYVLHPSADKAA